MDATLSGSGSTIDTNGYGATLSGVLSGSGSLVKTGAGALALSGVNTYAGSTTINAGEVRLGNGQALGTGVIFLSGGSLVGTADLTLASPLMRVSGTSGIAAATGTTLTLNTPMNLQAGSSLVFGSKSDAGTVEWSQPSGSGYATNQVPTLRVAGGTLRASDASFGNWTGALTSTTVDAGARIDLNDFSTYIQNLQGAGELLTGTTTAAAALVNTGNFSGVVSGAGSLTSGYGHGLTTLTLSGQNTYTGGTTVEGGTLALTGTGSIAASSGVVVANLGKFDISGATAGASVQSLSGAGGVTLGSQTLTLTNASGTFSGAITGTGGLTLTGGKQSLTGANSYSGSTQVNKGTLALAGAGSLLANGAVSVGASGILDIAGLTGSSASIGTLQGSGGVALGVKTLATNASNDTLFNGVIDGKGSLVKQGTGTLTLDGINTFTGGTTVQAGKLVVGGAAGSKASLAGGVQVDSGAALGGHGTIGGNVALASGAHLAPGNSVGTLAVNGDLTLDKGSVLDFELGAPGSSFAVAGLSDSVTVGGNLSLNGATLNLSNAGGMGPGLYNLLSYTGTLSQTNGGIAFGVVPGTGLTLQYLTASKKINVVNVDPSLTLTFWNGNGMAAPGQLGGGDGTWSTTGASWSDANGATTAPMQPQPGFAIFGGAAGNVAVDNTDGAVAASGIQFASDGYRLSGDTLTLAATKASPGPVEVRVGDGSAGSAAWTATIANVIAGTDGLQKTGAGTLELTAANTYTGGTTLKAGTLSVANDATLGDAAGALTFDGGALKVTGSAFSTLSRGITLGAGGGTLDVDSAFNTLEVTYVVGGPGRLVKTGVGTLTLASANTYAGGTAIDGGTLNAMVSGALGTGAVAVNGGGGLVFRGTADAGNLSIAMAARDGLINGGYVEFKDKSSAGSATLVTAAGGNVTFADSSTAGNAFIENRGGGTTVWNTATAGKAHITNFAGGHTDFLDTGSAGQATLVNETGGLVDFFDTATADQATVINNAGGRVRISLLGANGVSIGSLSGAGNVLLGTKALTTGGLNTDTEVSGVISGNGGSLVKVGTGALTLSGANTYTGGTSLRQGRLNVGHSLALGTGALSMDDDTTLGFSADGVVLANAVKLTGQNDPVIDTGAFSATLAGAISGGGFITKQGTGTLTLSGANTYTGATNVAQGTLKAGAANTFSAASAHSVAAGATLDLAGFNQSVAALANSGTVSLVGAVAGTTLTVNGNYVGNNGVLKLGTALSGTGPSDRLVINGGTASGKTSVQVTNLGGLGALTAGNGIEVVTAQGGATTTAQTTKDAFALAGGHVDAGAYEYRLYAADASGAGENWFLRSSIPAATSPTSPGAPGVPIVTYRPEASLFASLPSQLRQGNLAMLGDLRKRVGDDDVKGTATAPTGSDRRAWARVLSTDIDIQQGGAVSPNSKGRLTGFQAGTDLLATSNWRAGLYVGQLDGDARVRGFASGIQNLAVGRNDLRSQYVGVYGTYTGDSGFYADAVVQSGRHRYTVEPLLGFGTGGKGNSLLGSIEVGQAFALGGSGWSVEPQLQLIHQHMDLGNSVITGAVVQPQADNGWIARAGVRLKGQLDTGVGTLQPYGRFNVYKTSSGADIARFVNGATTTDIAAPTGGTSSELAGGFTLALSQSTSLYGELGKLWASGGNAKVKSSVNGSLGVRVKW
ncbi:autotransporter-associated beta strand repeat-containing protein [Variovorax sp. RCC_210]|uniref:autotransporter-associated beta strand repeat-containing protein n=1 Tax=Variovorax sp. RCC_210 TaxID=3239217 RepID=UPI0035268E64